MALKIEAGGFYRTRDGRKVGPRVQDEREFSIAGDPECRLWHDDGERYLSGGSHKDDLIELADALAAA